MEVRISYPLSVASAAEYQAALTKVKQQKDASQNPATVIDVDIEDLGQGKFAGVIVLEVPV